MLAAPQMTTDTADITLVVRDGTTTASPLYRPPGDQPAHASAARLAVAGAGMRWNPSQLDANSSLADTWEALIRNCGRFGMVIETDFGYWLVRAFPHGYKLIYGL